MLADLRTDAAQDGQREAAAAAAVAPSLAAPRSQQCVRRRFVKPPPSCYAPRTNHNPTKRARSGGPMRPAPSSPRLASPPPRSPQGGAAAQPAQPTVVAQATPTLGARSVGAQAATFPHHHHAPLLALGLVVVLLGGGFLAYRLAPGTKRPPTSRAHQKRIDNAVRSIQKAQGAAQASEPHVPSQQHKGTPGSAHAESNGSAGAGSSTSTPNASGSPRAGANNLRLVTNGSSDRASPSSALSELLPSPSCVASTSAAILTGLERIGSVASGAFGAATGRVTARAASSKGKERSMDESENGVTDAGTSGEAHASGLASPSLAAVGDGGLSKRGRGKKGTKSGVLSPTGETGRYPTRSPAPRLSLREIGVNSDKIATSDSGVQTSGTSSPAHPGPRLYARKDSDPTPRHHTPAKPPDPPPSTTDAFAQTSPRLLTFPVPSASSADPGEPLAAPAARPPVLPLPFDLHASFQSTPAESSDAPASCSLPLSSAASISSSSSYPISASPPRSPSPSRQSRSRSPTNSSSHVPSSSSGSGSPHLGRRPSGASGLLTAPTSSSASAASTSPSPSPGRSKNARRKSGAATVSVLAAATDAPESARVVGLPGAIAAPRKSSASAASTGAAPSTPGGVGGQRVASGQRSPMAMRRLSTASSNASSGSAGGGGGGGKGKGGGGKGKGKSEKDKDRDEETIRVSAGAGGKKQIRGLGVELDDDLDGRSDSYFPVSSNGLRTPSWTSPESSPHPSQRPGPPVSLIGTTLATPTAQRPPWSPQLMAQQYTMIPPPPPSTRPPSRGSSLSVPPSLAPTTPLHGVASQQQVQSPAQLQQAQQQQQHAYVLAQAHAQAQLQAQYQHAIALQLQAQQLMQRQQQQQQQQQRRRTTVNGEDSDGFLSPSATATPATPSGFVAHPYGVSSPPLGSSTNGPPTAMPSLGASWSASHPASPLMPSFAAAQQQQQQQHQQQQLAAYAALQGASPTAANFPPMSQNSPYANGSAQYLGSPSPNGPVAYPLMHPSPTSAQFQQQQLARLGPAAAVGPVPPQQARPRLTSSVSAVASFGGNGKAPPASPVSTNGGLSASLGPSGGGTGKRRSPSVSNGSPAPAPSSAGNSGPISGGVQLGDPPTSWKNRLKQAEMDADRTAKELEIARWRLAVLEEEQRTMELENQEALRALATRAMRAEARIKLLEESARTPQANEPNAVSPTSQPVSSSSSSAAPSSRTSPIHPLTWLDLDSVSFTNPRPVHPPRAPYPPSPNQGSQRWRNKRNSYGFGDANGNGGGGGRRRLSAGPRRKSSTTPSVAAAPPQEIESEDEEVLIVLDAPVRRPRVHPRQPPSRRSSYIGEDDAIDPEVSSFLDEEEIPSIDIDDSEPLAGGGVAGESEKGSRLHPEFVGFLPSFLSPGRAPSTSTNGSPLFDAVECAAPYDNEADTSVASLPSFTLDPSPSVETETEDAQAGDVGSSDEVPTPTVTKVDARPAKLDHPVLSPVTSEQYTPRLPHTSSPPASPSLARLSTPSQASRPARSRSSSRDHASGRLRPEETPLPPSPLVHASA
ncbi:hypothetical protein Rhopal_006125-T1 [Rhodotorula paludigena]|uniref:Proteophosphoglycan ppg4 n=1 Tax=Rhodotorula paludigena TaxID=86838 RepID=A0AAV5GKD6_9BASI|nr:hypothetical protein Rhopal_006125-T1 [Rhodotorula paludigena]